MGHKSSDQLRFEFVKLKRKLLVLLIRNFLNRFLVKHTNKQSEESSTPSLVDEFTNEFDKYGQDEKSRF